MQPAANPALLPCRAAPGAWTFNSSIAGSNFTYTLNTTMVSMLDAEHQCACQGGHLVSYVSPEEQQVGRGALPRTSDAAVPRPAIVLVNACRAA